ncbi:hypothetical protein Plec18170_002307 [Paecilomyces lecythidis]
MSTVEDKQPSYPYIFEKNVCVPLQNGGIIRCNVYRPYNTEMGEKCPVLVTYGPYGKDIPYKDFNPGSHRLLNPNHQTEQSAWETPTPSYWTAHGYAVVRADEVGTGQSPGFLSVLTSGNTFDAFSDLIEWASDQKWSTGKIGLLGISYYAGTQWHVAARSPKGLAAIVPWEGFTDIYRDATRHGGILSNTFFQWWWNNQVGNNQYGSARARQYGPEPSNAAPSEKELEKMRIEIPIDNMKHRYRDDPRYSSVNLNLQDVKIPLLSVANWGGVGLHLRGNVNGFLHAASEFKYLRFIVGRHDLPFYLDEEVEIQRSFLDAFLNNDDRLGWSKKGKVPPVDLILREGDDHAQLRRRSELNWPLARTQYTNFYLSPQGTLLTSPPVVDAPQKLDYKALGTATSPESVIFMTPPLDSGYEITGHITARLNVSVTAYPWHPSPSDIDLFLTLRHVDSSGKELFYTGSLGEPIPVTRGWLRVSLRKINPNHPYHRPWLPHRDYCSTDILPVIPSEVYEVDVELWPTNVVVKSGERLSLEVSSGDTAQTGVWEHNDPVDRNPETFNGVNHLHFSGDHLNYITLPIIPAL